MFWNRDLEAELCKLPAAQLRSVAETLPLFAPYARSILALERPRRLYWAEQARRMARRLTRSAAPAPRPVDLQAEVEAAALERLGRRVGRNLQWIAPTVATARLVETARLYGREPIGLRGESGRATQKGIDPKSRGHEPGDEKTTGRARATRKPGDAAGGRAREKMARELAARWARDAHFAAFDFDALQAMARDALKAGGV